ncbi:MAG: hypothetical protein Ct9H300mP16_16330 [Pseudomonadota bacterium]|nr:MAG: hypothetical protein Ct9H300mP16_16330 [Pseudomonadota bacterium]
MPAAWWSSGLGVHVVWTLPFGFLVMMAVLTDLIPVWRRQPGTWVPMSGGVQRSTFPLILPGVVAAGLFGFTLSYDEFARNPFVGGRIQHPAAGYQCIDDAADSTNIVCTGYGLDSILTVMIALFLAIYSVLYRRTH